MFRAISVKAFGGPDTLVLDRFPQLIPTGRQVVVEVHAAGVNPVETYIRTGTHAVKPKLPYTPGNDGAGIVTQIGPDVASTTLKVGDRVFISKSISGTYAEQALCDESHVHALPTNLSFIQGAAISTAYMTAYRALIQRGQAQPGEHVLIHGASGGVGLAAVQLCAWYGMYAIGTASSLQGRELIRAQGAMHALDHHHRPQHQAASTATATSSSSSSSDPYLKQCLELTHGHGIDLILEMLANVNLGYDLKLLAPNGRVCVIGNRGEAQMNARDLMTNEADIRGVYLPRSTDAQRAECVAALQAGWAAGALTPVVGQTFKLEEAAQAHELVMSHEPTLGKVVLDCTK